MKSETAQAPLADGDVVKLERDLVLEVVRVTEEAAIAASRVAGKGDSDLVDQAGTDAMRRVLNELDIDGEIVIGEGERDEAPMLYIGEQVGRAGSDSWEVDIAVDPVEGTSITARLINNAVAVIAVSEKGGLLQAPDIYMDKLIVGPPAAGKVDLRWPVAANLHAVALSLDRSVEDLTVVILDRERHRELISEVRAAGRSEEHTSELQSRGHLVCRLLLEKKKQNSTRRQND